MGQNNPFLRAEGDPIHVPAGGMPQVLIPSAEIFKAMGQENIFLMCRDLYKELERTKIRDMFHEDMGAASEKFAAFLVYRLGGPPLYQQRHGNPMMRKRHLTFVITDENRRIWLGAFKKTLEGAEQKYSFPREHLPGFIVFLEGFSVWMVNAA